MSLFLILSLVLIFIVCAIITAFAAAEHRSGIERNEVMALGTVLTLAIMFVVGFVGYAIQEDMRDNQARHEDRVYCEAVLGGVIEDDSKGYCIVKEKAQPFEDGKYEWGR